MQKNDDAIFCAGSGGSGIYSKKDRLAVHKGMNISEQEFITIVDGILMAVD